jgi:hypothetical protein
MNRWLLLLALLLLSIMVAACLPDVPEPVPTLPLETATPTPDLTDTIVWFPPTATYTPAPTRESTPTPELRPLEGDVILIDTFTEREGWQVARSVVGSIAYGQDELTLAVSSPRGLLVSFRSAPALADFYLEVNVEPNLCRGSDAYGLLLRAQSSGDYYRLLLNCNGEVRFERLMNSRSLPLHDWIGSGLPPGGMIPARLGVWALKDEMRVFVNGVHQFTVRDKTWNGGQIGVFARSAGDTPLTVSFSQLEVYTVEGGRLPPMPAATEARPSATPKP